MSIKDALNYTVKTNSTGLKRPSMSSEEDMDKRLAEMRKNNMRRAPGAPGVAQRPAKPLKSPSKTVVKTKPIVKEKPVKVEPDVDVDEFAAPPVKAKPVKEKPVKEKPVKEKPAKERRGLFGRRKSEPEEEKVEEPEEDDGDIIFDDVEEGGDLFSKEDMSTTMEDLLDDEDKAEEEDSGIDGIRDIKDIEVKKIDQGRLEELERDDEDKDMKIFKPRREAARFENPKFKGPGPDLAALERSGAEKADEEEGEEKAQPHDDVFSGKQDGGHSGDSFDSDFIIEETDSEEETAAKPVHAENDGDQGPAERSGNQKEAHSRDQKKEMRNNDIFDSDEDEEGAGLPDRREEKDEDKKQAELNRANVLRREIERNASIKLPVEDIRNAENHPPVKRETGAIPAVPGVNKVKRRPVPSGQEGNAPAGEEAAKEAAPGAPVNTAQRRRGVPAGETRPKIAKGERPSMPPVNIPANLPANAAPGTQAAGPLDTRGKRPVPKRPGTLQDPAAAGKSQAPGQEVKANQQIRTVRNANTLGVRPLKPNGKAGQENTDNTVILTAAAGAATAAPARPRKKVPERQTGTEKKKEAGRREFESRRRNLNEDDFKESSFPIQIISYVAVAIIVIIALICAFRGIEFNKLSPLVLGIISVIMVVMGIFLGMIPSFITLLISAAALVAGALTGFFSEVVSALVVLLATVTALKGRKG